MTKEAFIVFEQGGPLTNQVVHLLYSGLGAHGRFTVPLRGVWVLVFYNRNKFGAGIREGDCTINFITISDTDEPVNDDSSSDNTGGTQSSTTLDILGIFKMVIIPLLIIIVAIFTLSLFLFILHDNKHDHPKTTKRKVRQEISKILHKRGGTLMRSRKFYGIEWVNPVVENEDIQEQGSLELSKSFSREVFEKSYYFHRNGQLVIRLKIHEYLFQPKI